MTVTLPIDCFPLEFTIFMGFKGVGFWKPKLLLHLPDENCDRQAAGSGLQQLAIGVVLGAYRSRGIKTLESKGLLS